MPHNLPNISSVSLQSFEPFSKVRLIVMDLDGTLLKSGIFEAPLIAIKLINKLRHRRYNKVTVTIATGRTYHGAAQLVEGLRIPRGIPVIVHNGAVIISNKSNIISHQKIEMEAFNYLFKFTNENHIKTISYFVKGLSGKFLEEEALGWASDEKPFYEYNNMPVKWYSGSVVDPDLPPSIMIIYTNGDENKFNKSLAMISKLDDISYSYSGMDYIEVKPKNCNKGSALKEVASRFGFHQNEIVAIGDNDNDAEMLEWAGIGVAVKTASQEALRYADYISKGGVLSGAIEVLDLVCRSIKYLG